MPEQEQFAGFEHDFYEALALEEALRTGIPPTPFEYNDDWECEKCEMLLLCENSRSLAGLLEGNASSDGE